MLRALALASRGEGRVSPNPLVGAVIVKNGKAVGEGWHRVYGGRHAEANALRKTGRKARGADLYVTLEPCNHYGKQPPCTKAIIDAGIKRVFIATEDPNKVSRNGAAELRRRGIEVRFGLCETEAKKQNEFYIKGLRLRRPFITIKTAMSGSGMISFGDMKAKRVSGKAAAAFTQDLRKKHDALVVGLNTIIADNPKLNYRKDSSLNPVRVVLDSRAKTPPNARIFSGKGGVIIACTKRAGKENIYALKKIGARVLVAKDEKGLVDLEDLMGKLFSAGISSVLVEAGHRTATSFLEKKLFDRLIIIVAGREIKAGLGAFSLKRKIRARLVGEKMLGEDLLLVVEK